MPARRSTPRPRPFDPVGVVWVALLLTAGCAASVEAPRAYDSPLAPIAPVVDGSLDDPAWDLAPWTELFGDIRGAGQAAPTWDTRAKILWDDRYLYVAAFLEEPDLWATLTERDAIIYRDHDFEVFLDPDGDGLAYYEIEINALGTVFDLFLPKPYADGGRAVLDWDMPGLRSAVRLDGTLNDPSDRDAGWSVELAVPWAELVPPTGPAAAGPPRPGDVWRLNFSRVQWPLEVVEGRYRKTVRPTPDEPHPEHNWVWSPQGEIDMHVPEMWGRIRFLGPAPTTGVGGSR